MSQIILNGAWTLAVLGILVRDSSAHARLRDLHRGSEFFHSSVVTSVTARNAFQPVTLISARIPLMTVFVRNRLSRSHAL